ncbi:MAG: DUF47 family protein [Desulfovibrionaceae bacterium]|nr:DUF47 family protein [Desulfovibrionaceae bacterium]
MLASLLPKSAPFFEMLLEQNQLLRHMADQNLKMFGEADNRPANNSELSRIENDADLLYRNMLRALSATFITPIDREDILRISQAQEECFDRFQRLSIRITAYSVPTVPFPAMRVAEILTDMLGLTTEILQGLVRRHDAHKTRAFRNLREECDSLLAVGLAEVMEENGGQDGGAVMVLKWIQVYDALEFVIRQVTELFELIEEAVMKNV